MRHTITAPLAGRVIEVSVSENQKVSPGDLLATLESMKVQVRVEAEQHGIVQKLLVKAEQQVDRDAELLHLEISDQQASTERSTQQNKEHHPLIGEWQQRQQLSLDEARPAAIEKRHQRGGLSARENLALLCDTNTFQEYGQLAVAAQRQRRDYEELKTATAADGVITGIANINGTKVALIINDYTVLAGTQGFFHHQKIDRMLEIAKRQNLPIIMYTEGGGGRPGDTDVTVVNSGLQCASFGSWAGLTGVVPRISVAHGYNFAGNAALFGAADITIATQQSYIGMAGPAMIEGGGLGEFKPTEIGPIDVQSNNGTVDIVAADEQEAAQIAKRVMHLFTAKHLENFSAADQQALNQSLPINRRQTYDVRNIIETITDQETFIELRAAYGASLVTGLARLAGNSIGILASDCRQLGGAIDVDAGEKAAHFMQLCDQFNIPILSFCDTPGFMVGPQHEERGAVRRLAEMFRIGAQLNTPFYAVVLRKCYGLGAQALLGGSTSHPDATLSWPSGEFGPMGLEGAVKLGFSKELAAAPDEAAREKLFDQLLEQLYQRGQAVEVASVLEVDAVIEPSETRNQLAMLLANQ